MLIVLSLNVIVFIAIAVALFWKYRLTRDAGFHHNRGSIYKDLGEFELAIKDFDAAIGLEPLNNLSRQTRGVAKMLLGKCDSAVEDFDAVLETRTTPAPYATGGWLWAPWAGSTKPQGLRAILAPGTRQPRRFHRPGVGIQRPATV